MQAALSGVSSNPLGSLQSSLSPTMSREGDILERSTIVDKQNEISSMKQEPQAPQIIQTGDRGKSAGQNGMQMGVQTPMNVYNNESSLRRLVDSLIAYSFS